MKRLYGVSYDWIERYQVVVWAGSYSEAEQLAQEKFGDDIENVETWNPAYEPMIASISSSAAASSNYALHLLGFDSESISSRESTTTQP